MIEAFVHIIWAGSRTSVSMLRPLNSNIDHLAQHFTTQTPCCFCCCCSGSSSAIAIEKPAGVPCLYQRPTEHSYRVPIPETALDRPVASLNGASWCSLRRIRSLGFGQFTVAARCHCMSNSILLSGRNGDQYSSLGDQVDGTLVK